MRERESRSRSFARRLRRRMTDAETIVWTRLRRGQLEGWKFRRQHPVGAYIADFACLDAGLIIEVDGAPHSERQEIAHDARRSAYLEERGYLVLRVFNTDIYDNLDGVLEGVLNALPPSGPSGHLPRERGRKTNAAVDPQGRSDNLHNREETP